MIDNNLKQNAKEKIAAAFLELLKTKPYKKIKVTEIIEKAGINRSSFYRHFEDVYDLFDKIENKVAQDIADSLNEIEYRKDCIEPITELFCVKLFIAASEKEDLLRLLMGENGEGIAFCYKLNSAAYFKLLQKAKKANVLTELINRGINFTVSVTVIHIYVSLFISDFLNFKPEYSYERMIDFNKTILENLLCNHEVSKSERKVFHSFLKVFAKNKDANVSVSDITKAAKISRGTFYNNFSSIDKFESGTFLTFASAFSKYVLHLCKAEKSEAIKIKLVGENELTDDEKIALKWCFQSGVFLKLLLCSLHYSYKPYFEAAEKSMGSEFVSKNKITLGNYLISVTCFVFYSVFFPNSAESKKILYDLYLLKDVFKIKF